jgi:signal transduction histidine kinase
MRLRRAITGVRGRLVVALVATSAVTLAVAAVALFSALEPQLRRDERHDLRTAVVEARGAFAAAGGAGRRLHLAALRHQALALELRTGAHVAVFDGRHVAIIDTDRDAPMSAGGAFAALRTGQTKTAFLRDDATVAVPLRIAGRSFALVAERRLTDAARTAGRVARASAVAAGAGLVTALVLGMALAGALLRRLRRLRDAAGQLALKGLDAPAPQDSGKDEIGELADAFARMRERLQREEAARRAFVATASHELRTPVASLQGMLELISNRVADGTLHDPRVAGEIAAASEQSARLGRLASDLLDLSRIERGLELRSEPVDLVEVCRAVLAEFDTRAAAHRVRLDVVQRGERPWALGDPDAVARILRITVDNALRFAPAGDVVRVSTAVRDGTVLTTIDDRGPGVPPIDREVIFDRFQRGSARSDEAGFGLGLAIGRELAHGMGGDLVLDAEHAPGARFELRLALAPMDRFLAEPTVKSG